MPRRSHPKHRSRRRFVLKLSGNPTIEPGRSLHDQAIGLLGLLGGGGGAAQAGGRILGSLDSYETCLIELPAAQAASLRSPGPMLRGELRERYPDLIISAEQTYRPSVYQLPAKMSPPRHADLRPKQPLRLRIQGEAGLPIAGANVWAYTDFPRQKGAFAVSDRNGRAELHLGGAVKHLQHLRVVLRSGRMPVCTTHPGKGRKFESGDRVLVPEAIDLRKSVTSPILRHRVPMPHRDGLRWLFDEPPLSAGKGVVVGIVDSGVDASHEVFAGTSIIEVDCHLDHDTDRGPTLIDHHGTHVAAIIGGLTGLSPSASIRSLRVMGPGAEEAQAYYIISAIRRAVDEFHCDIINISLGDGEASEAIDAAMMHARDNGSVIVASAGNGGRGPVTYPARSRYALAVSSFGVRGSYAPDSSEASEEAEPYCRSGRHFIARSSNIGPEIKLSAPGVGIISAFRGGGLGIMTGTSQAAAIISGLAARLLSADPILLGAIRDRERSSRIEALILDSARRLHFGPEPCRFEGQGVPSLTISVTGDPCPRGGLWEIVGPPSRRETIAEGDPMPASAGADVSWRMVR